MADMECFQQQMNDLEEVYGTKIAPREMKVMFSRLGHLTNEQLIFAVDSAIAEYHQRPHANAILEFIEGKKTALLNQEAQQEWGNVMEQLHQPFDQPIHLKKRTSLALKHIGGISALREAPLNQLTWRRKEFIEQYKGIEELQGLQEGLKESQETTKTLEETTKPSPTPLSESSSQAVPDSLNSKMRLQRLSFNLQ